MKTMPEFNCKQLTFSLFSSAWGTIMES